MKRLVKILIVSGTLVSCAAQGTVLFNNRTSTGDAKVTLWDGSGAGLRPGSVAQLWLVNGASYTALSPTTTFRSSSAAAAYFVNPVEVTVPGISAGSPATFVMRAWDSTLGSYESARAAGLGNQSNPVTVPQLGGIPPGGGAPIPTPDLAGLLSFPMYIIPEPSTLALGLAGSALLLLARRKNR